MKVGWQLHASLTEAGPGRRRFGRALSHPSHSAASITVFLSLLLMACGGGSAGSGNQPQSSDDATLVAAAKAEGSLLLYATPSQEALQSDASAFEKAYGIKVTYIRLTSTPLTSRVDTEAGAGRIRADVIFTADQEAMNRWSDKALLAKLPQGVTPKTTDYYAPIQITSHALGYNTDAIKMQDVPKTWNDVLNTKWKGRIVLGSPRISPAWSSLYYSLLHDPKYGMAYFEKLAKLNPRVVASDVLVVQALLSGDAEIGIPTSVYNIVNTKAANPTAPVGYQYMDIESAVYTWVTVVAQAQHPNAAALFAKWMMSPAGQIANCGQNRATSVLGPLPGTQPGPPANTVPKQTVLDVSKEYSAIINMFDKLFK
jgi:iron(III) transport system substrate-binding protein